MEVVSIQEVLIPPENFYSIVSSRNGNIIIDGGVVSHEHYIKVKDLQNNSVYPIDVVSSDRFKTVK
jgi:hypothetical protein